MPRFFFETCGDDCTVQDEEGVEMYGIHTARDEAVRTLPALARDVLLNGEWRDIVMTIKDASGRPVVRARLSITVEWL